MLTTYAEFAPTSFDRRGAFLPERADWLVVPCGRNRDSRVLAESNFHVALERLGDESETVEVHRFGHWACGWFEIILVHPSRADEVSEIADALASYPILDESDWSEREYEAAAEYWDSETLRGRVELCQEAGVSIFGARPGRFPDDPNGDLYEILRADV